MHTAVAEKLAKKHAAMSRKERLRYLQNLYFIWQWRRKMAADNNEGQCA